MRSLFGPNAGEEFNTLTNSLEPVVDKEASVVRVSVVWLGQGAVGVGATRPPSGVLPATLQGTQGDV